MKTLLFSCVALMLTGCAGMDGQRFMQNFGAGLQGSAQQQQPSYTNVTQKRTDNQCFQNCTQAGYQYGLCQSKCTY